MCTKAEGTGSEDLSAPAKPRWLLSGLFSLKLPPDGSSTWKNKKAFSSLLISYCNSLLKSFPVTTCFQTSCSAYTFKKCGWVGDRITSLLLHPHTRKRCLEKPQDGLRIPRLWEAILSLHFPFLNNFEKSRMGRGGQQEVGCKAGFQKYKGD